MHSATLTQEQLQQIIELQGHIGSANFHLEEFMQLMVTRLQEYTKACGAAVELLEGHDMVYHATGGSLAPFHGFRLPVEGSLSGLCIQTAEIAHSRDTATDSRVNKEACRKIGAASMVVVPLLYQDMPQGVLKIISRTPDAFTDTHLYTLRLMSRLLGAAMGQQLQMRSSISEQLRLERLAQHDALTGLPNRSLLHDRLNQALLRSQRSESHLALMYLDIDHFKTINDTHGHATGDALLRAFSGRIRAAIRATDTLARLGGDEFVLLAEQLHTLDEAEYVARKVVECVRLPFDLPGITLNVSTSMGLAIADGGHTAESLIHQADCGLCKAKRAGRNQYAMETQPPASAAASH